MTDLPILFSGPMIRALLAGRKTQTRRILKPQPKPSWHSAIVSKLGFASFIKEANSVVDMDLPVHVGDRLWVRETWSGTHVFRNTKPSLRESFIGDGTPYFREEVWYWADGSPEFGDWEKPRVSIHMPRWASRLTLIVTDVRVQRLQDISEDDAMAEGATNITPALDVAAERGLPTTPARCGFRTLWNSINGPDAWAANPWVAAYTFDVHRHNIDRMPGPKETRR